MHATDSMLAETEASILLSGDQGVCLSLRALIGSPCCFKGTLSRPTLVKGSCHCLQQKHTRTHSLEWTVKGVRCWYVQRLCVRLSRGLFCACFQLSHELTSKHYTTLTGVTMHKGRVTADVPCLPCRCTRKQAIWLTSMHVLQLGMLDMQVPPDCTLSTPTDDDLKIIIR